MKKLPLLLLLLSIISVMACEDDDDVQPDPNYIPGIYVENFVSGVDNTYFPITPGKIYTYESQTPDGLETIVITMLAVTKVVAGITCAVVRDSVSLDGEVIEDTYDWFAQDVDGNVWYMGEDVSNYENGVLVDHEGSFETGIDNAKPGMIMLASPVLEYPYRQEYAFGKAEDWGKVIGKGLTVTTTYGTFQDCIKTEDWNALEPDAPHEYKYYAPGIGLVKEEIEGSTEFVELISIQ